jgi:hypothetical protein
MRSIPKSPFSKNISALGCSGVLQPCYPLPVMAIERTDFLPMAFLFLSFVIF